MKKFKVLVEGKNFYLKGKEFNNKNGYGFFTTRFIEADEENFAIKEVLNLIKEELKEYVEKSTVFNQPEMFIEKITQIDSFIGIKVPGKGFTWYPMN